jgi:uncharacterized protein
LRLLYSNLVKFTLWVIPAVGFVFSARRARSVRYLGISVSPTNRHWILCLTVTILFLCGVIGLETSVGRKTLSFSGLHFSTTVVGLLFFFVSPLMEEILFRGLVTKEFLVILPSWGANLVASLLFVGVHLPYWLSHGGVTEVMASNAIGVFVFSLLAGWLYTQSGTIWPSVVAHVANNFVAALLVSRHG